MRNKGMKRFLMGCLLGILGVAGAHAQPTGALRERIEAIVAAKDAVVGVAITVGEGRDTLTVNGGRRFPMQSVFKFPIALAILAEVDQGRLSLDRPVTLAKDDLLPGLYSPIREAHPEGATLTVAELLRYTVSLSDNAGCDALLRLLSKPRHVQRFLRRHGFRDIAIAINEETMQADWDSQFRNWTTPREANRILRAFHENRGGLLRPASHGVVWALMEATETGRNRLKGRLPAGTVVAHKTGWSGRNEATGITAAVNDIGVVTLPDGTPLYISVFVTESTEGFDTNERIIADIARAAWDHYTGGGH